MYVLKILIINFNFNLHVHVCHKDLISILIYMYMYVLITVDHMYLRNPIQSQTYKDIEYKQVIGANL
jgi:hypothetical protein